MKGLFWGLNIAPKEFNNNRNTFLVCIARMRIHYLESISIVWCHSNFLLFVADYWPLFGGRKKTTLFQGNHTVIKLCDMIRSAWVPGAFSVYWNSGPRGPVYCISFLSVPSADRSHSLKKFHNLKNKRTSRGMKWKARAKKNSMKEKYIIGKGKNTSQVNRNNIKKNQESK